MDSRSQDATQCLICTLQYASAGITEKQRGFVTLFYHVCIVDSRYNQAIIKTLQGI